MQTILVFVFFFVLLLFGMSFSKKRGRDNLLWDQAEAELDAQEKARQANKRSYFEMMTGYDDDDDDDDDDIMDRKQDMNTSNKHIPSDHFHKRLPGSSQLELLRAARLEHYLPARKGGRVRSRSRGRSRSRSRSKGRCRSRGRTRDRGRSGTKHRKR